MIQRYLYAALKHGIEAVQEDLTILDQFFADQFDLSEVEIEAIKTYFQTNPPTIKHGYARSNSEMPLISVVLADEQEVEMFMGDEAGMVEEEGDPDYGADIYGDVWQHVYHIYIYSEHHDVTTYYYELCKHILLIALQNIFQTEGLHGTHISGGELAPDPQYIPEHLFLRRLVFRCRSEFYAIDKESALAKAFAYRGIAIDSSGSPRDVGGVKTLVTTYTEE